MAKTIILNESCFNEHLMQQAVMDNQLPEWLRGELINNKAPLIGTQALPYEGFIERELAKRFVELQIDDENLSELIFNIQEIEKPYRKNLEALCTEMVFDFFQVPSDKIDYIIGIVDSVDASDNEVPYDKNEQLRQAVSPYSIESYITKRRAQNAIISGAAMAYAKKLIEAYSGAIDEIDVNLVNLYSEFFDLSEYSLYIEKDSQSPDDNREIGRTIVHIGDVENKNNLMADGVILPVLVYETIKGLFEIISEHGMPDDEELTNIIRSKCDYLKIEPWYMRLGPIMWDYMVKCSGPEIMNDGSLAPYVAMKMAQLNPDKHNILIKEILKTSKRAKIVMQRLINYASTNIEKSDFNSRMQKHATDNVIMTDNEKIKPQV